MSSRVLRVVGVVSLLAAFGCKNSLIDRSLVFTTHTTMGLEISVSP